MVLLLRDDSFFKGTFESSVSSPLSLRETGEAEVFGRSRIVPGTGAICISQRQFGDIFQMINPHKKLVQDEIRQLRVSFHTRQRRSVTTL